MVIETLVPSRFSYDVLRWVGPRRYYSQSVIFLKPHFHDDINCSHSTLVSGVARMRSKYAGLIGFIADRDMAH